MAILFYHYFTVVIPNILLPYEQQTMCHAYLLSSLYGVFMLNVDRSIVSQFITARTGMCVVYLMLPYHVLCCINCSLLQLNGDFIQNASNHLLIYYRVRDISVKSMFYIKLSIIGYLLVAASCFHCAVSHGTISIDLLK